MLCGVFAVHFTSLHSFVVVVVSIPVEEELHLLHILHIDVVPVEKERTRLAPCARGIECTYPNDLMLAHRGYQDFRFQFESSFCSAQTASLANCGAGDLSKCSNSLPFCLCLFNKNLTFCQTFLFFLW